MTNKTSAPPRRFGQHDIIGIILGLIAIGGLLWIVRNDSVWPDTPLWLAGCFPPMLLTGIRTWNRLLHPNRAPEPWPAGSPRHRQLTRTTVTLMSVGALLMCVSLGVRGAHPLLGRATGSFFLACEIWGYLIQRYNQDRVAIRIAVPAAWTSPDYWEAPIISGK